MLKFKISEKEFESDDIGKYIGYGIVGIENESILCFADDLTDSESDIINLISIMNESDVDIIHFEDIIEDFIS